LINDLEVAVTQQGEEYLTSEEASAYLGVSRRTLERYVKQGLIPRYRRGISRVVFKRPDLDRFLEVRPDRSTDQDDQ
jgi:excisionase family DNA binding protein